ncbi:MAG TPA: DinB family protein [Pyrinomonadaceae bacterium]|nr:DinB family protein [Pyrinomonadaceae bacterium]
MSDAAREFILKARSYLVEDYLPKIERCLAQLSDDEVWWRANPESNSIGNLLLHLAGNVRQWIVSGVGGERDARVRRLEFDQREVVPREELLGRLRQTLSEVDGVLSGLDPAGVLESRHIQGYDVTVLEAVFHVVEHFSMHTGQIILLTKLLKGADLQFYDFSGGDPVPAWKAEAGG